MTSLLPPDQSTVIADLLKRVEVLERTARVPQMTRTSGGWNGESIDTNLPFVTGDDWAPLTDGPSVPVTVTASGRLVVLIEAVVLVESANEFAGVYTSYRIDGPTDVAPSIDWSLPRFADGSGRTVTFYVHEGLEPGDYTVTMEAQSTGVDPDTSTWDRRNLLVIPL